MPIRQYSQASTTVNLNDYVCTKCLSKPGNWNWSCLNAFSEFCPWQKCCMPSLFLMSCPHFSHVWYRSRSCIFWCLFRCDDCANLLSQPLHLKGFSPLWTRICDCKWIIRVNLLLQISHENGFSPLWIKRCLLRVDDTVKDLPHSWQEKGFSPAKTIDRFSGMNELLNRKVSWFMEQRRKMALQQAFPRVLSKNSCDAGNKMKF